MEKNLNFGDKCKDGFQLRPDIVWFGEMVPALEKAISICLAADIFVVIGTSLLVYPAASLVDYTQINIPKYIIDPKIPYLPNSNFSKIEKGAVEGTQILKEKLKTL